MEDYNSDNEERTANTESARASTSNMRKTSGDSSMFDNWHVNMMEPSNPKPA